MAPARLAELGAHARADVESEAALPRVIGRLMELYRGVSPSAAGRERRA
jgi:hypothetical protein